MNKKSTNRNSGGWLYSKDSNNRTKEYYPVLKKRKRKGCSAGINKYYFSPTTNFYKRTSTSENEIILTSLKGGKKIAKKFYLSNPNNKSVPSTSVHKNEEVIYTKEESIGVVNQREIENNFIVPSTNHKEADPTPVVQPPPKQPAPQLKTPPKETKFAVEKENLTRGTIRLTPGIKKWAKYYNLKVLDLICYANYIINYKLDNTGNSALKDWYDEHRIEVDNIIHLKVENTNTFEVRIFTEYELYNYEANKGKKSGLRKRFSGNARDLIFLYLSDKNEYCYYKEITEKLTSKGYSESTVNAELSKNNHLFCKAGEREGYWGLKQWSTDKLERVYSNNLLYSHIADYDVIFKVIEEYGPITNEEIIERLNNKYAVKNKIFNELSILSIPKRDERLEYSDGIWSVKKEKPEPPKESPSEPPISETPIEIDRTAKGENEKGAPEPTKMSFIKTISKYFNNIYIRTVKVFRSIFNDFQI